MKKHTLMLFLIPALVLGLACAFPAEDLPQTPYDESQGMAFESVPLLSARALQDLIHTTQPIQPSLAILPSNSSAWNQEACTCVTAQSIVLNFGEITDRASPLRC
jgi:hypothetical protein